MLAECTPPTIETRGGVLTILHYGVVALPGFTSGKTRLTDPVTSARLAARWWNSDAVKSILDIGGSVGVVAPDAVKQIVIEDAHEAPVRQLVTALLTGAYCAIPDVTVHLVRPSTVKAKWKLGLHGHEANKKVAVAFVKSRWPELANGIGRSDHTCDALLTGLVGLYKSSCWDVSVILAADMPWATTEDEETEIYLTHNSRAPKQCWHVDCNAHKKPDHKPNKFFQSGPYLKDGEEVVPESAGCVMYTCGGKFNPGCGEKLIVCFENGEFSDMIDEKIKEGVMRDGWLDEMKSAFSEPSKEWHRFHKRTAAKRPAESAPEDEPAAKVQATPEMAQLMAVINTLAQQVTTVNAQVALLTSKMESAPTASSSE